MADDSFDAPCPSGLPAVHDMQIPVSSRPRALMPIEV
jgi:hypothetical protein